MSVPRLRNWPTRRRGCGGTVPPAMETTSAALMAGKPTLNEGFVFAGDGELVPARVAQAPWLGQMQASGEEVPVVLETVEGTTTVHGETLLSTFMVLGPLAGFALHQAIVRYEWDGERANGMMERSRTAQ
jgi:hypothetical protein